MAQVSNSFYYLAAPTRVWVMVTDFAALAHVCRPYLRFQGLPEGRLHKDQHINVGVRLFGALPPQDYTMTLVDYDEEGMTFASHEYGAGVRKWDHTLTLTPQDNGTRLDETIEIEAGLFTPIMVAWARLLYRGRHAKRLGLLDSGAF